MAQPKTTSIDTNYQYQRIALERTLWVVKPVAMVMMVMWCLHPATTRGEMVDRNVLAGFLMGSAYGIFVNRKVLRYFLITRRKQKRQVRNEVPDEYYFGNITERMDGE